ncbi:MAG: Zn-ribbon domain-containing OB-fold protein [Actinomycetota bacterium]
MTSPVKSPADEYKDHLANGELHIQRCLRCDRAVFFPRSVCPHCGHNELQFQQAQGSGVVYSATVINRKPERGGPYNVVLIDLPEGVVVMSQVIDTDPDEVRIGAQVQAVIETRDEEPVLLFRMGGAA